MARKKDEAVPLPPSRPPATNREQRQAELENLAMDLAERQMRSGEASSQVITHYLRSASTRGRIEELRLKADVALMEAKKSHLESQEELQNMFKNAIDAMSGYRYENGEGDEHVD